MEAPTELFLRLKDFGPPAVATDRRAAYLLVGVVRPIENQMTIFGSLSSKVVAWQVQLTKLLHF